MDSLDYARNERPTPTRRLFHLRRRCLAASPPYRTGPAGMIDAARIAPRSGESLSEKRTKSIVAVNPGEILSTIYENLFIQWVIQQVSREFVFLERQLSQPNSSMCILAHSLHGFMADLPGEAGKRSAK